MIMFCSVNSAPSSPLLLHTIGIAIIVTMSTGIAITIVIITVITMNAMMHCFISTSTTTLATTTNDPLHCSP